MADFEWLSLDEFHRQVLENIEKSDVDVKAHDKVVSGHVVHVRNYQQNRPNAATPVIGISGPTKHFNKPAEPKKVGGKPEATTPAKYEPPTDPAEISKYLSSHPGCPTCHAQKGKPTPKDGTIDKFEYAPPENPLEGKIHNQISLDDIAQAIHKFPLVHSAQARRLKEGVPRYKSLTPEQKEKHLKNDPFAHLTEDAKVALKRDMAKITKKKFNMIGEWLQLPRLEGYDPETLHPDFVNRLIEEMQPFVRTEYEHGYAKAGSKEHAAAIAKHGKDVPLHYHQGMDTEKINSGSDLIKEARVRVDKWARRFLEKEAGFDKLLNNKEIKAQTEIKGKIYKKQHEIEKLQKKAGIDIGQPKIDTSMNYDLSELEKIADKTGYRIEKETSPSGGLQRIAIFEDDPTTVMSGFVDEDKAGTPKEVIDLTQGGKLSDVRDKLAGLVNPSSVAGDVPLKKFRELEDTYKDQGMKLANLHKDRAKLQEKIDRESVPPEEHYKTMTEYASKLMDEVEGLQSNNKNIQEVSTGISTALEHLEDNEFPQGMSFIKNAKLHLQEAKKDGVKGAAIDKIGGLLEKIQADAEAYQGKRTMSPQKRKTMIEELEGKLNELDGDISDQEKQVGNISGDLEQLKGDDSVQKYIELKNQLNDFQTKLDAINPTAEAHWQVALEKQNPEGEDVGNYADDLALKQYQQSLKEGDQEPDTDWEEIVPETVNNVKDEKELTHVGGKLVQAINHNPSGKFLFGSQDDVGHQFGLVHVGKLLADRFVESGDVDNIIEKFLSDHPVPDKTGGKVPDIYKIKGTSALANENYHRWKKIHDLYRYHPTKEDEAAMKKMSSQEKEDYLSEKETEHAKLIGKYAMRFSDYYPFPMGVSDFYNEQGKTDNKGEPLREWRPNADPKLAQAILATNKTKDEESRKLPTDKVFQWQYYYLLRFLGNHVMEEITKHNPEQKAIFDKIKDLNKPHSGGSDALLGSPGNLRRELKRRMDVLYGHYAGDVPHTKKQDAKSAHYPEWEHDVADPQEWLTSIGHEKEEKSLVVYADDLKKGRVSHVIFTDEKVNFKR